MAATRRLGFFGGTFDPPHLGHLRMAQAVRDHAGIDGVVLVPAARNPHKAGPPLFADAVRIRALRALAASEPGLAIWEGELRRPPPSYTYDTVVELEREFPDCELWWILGADNVAALPGWHRATELARRIGFLALGRPGVDTAAAEAQAREALPELRLRWVAAPLVGVSATEIRRRIEAGLPWQDLVPSAIAGVLAGG